ncbi:MAG TPA: RsiV family protein, partial [Mucilaginibacter sp.]|nr:RsiV family protein [Mucilaginibacter sp.]
WDTKANKDIALNDLFETGYQDKLKGIAEAIFRKDEKLSDTASLANDYFFKDNKFALNDNFSITPTGFKFIYNQYEIKPYAAGITTLVIPYSQIKSLLRPNTVVTKYAK